MSLVRRTPSSSSASSRKPHGPQGPTGASGSPGSSLRPFGEEGTTPPEHGPPWFLQLSGHSRIPAGNSAPSLQTGKPLLIGTQKEARLPRAGTRLTHTQQNCIPPSLKLELINSSPKPNHVPPSWPELYSPLSVKTQPKNLLGPVPARGQSPGDKDQT